MRVVIIEDDIKLRDINRLMLERNFPNIDIVGEASNVIDSIKIINNEQPDIVLMDVELEGGNCFQVLQSCKPYTFKPIFITAHNQYAIKAIKFNALDYIMKPINEFEFCEAINKAISEFNLEDVKLQTDNLTDQFMDHKSLNKIVLRTSENLILADVNDVCFCKSDNSYTSFFMMDGKEIIVSRSIKEFSDLLYEHHFIRPHQSFLVNLNAIEKIDKSDGGFIIMKNKKEIPISQRRKKDILDLIGRL